MLVPAAETVPAVDICAAIYCDLDMLVIVFTADFQMHFVV